MVAYEQLMQCRPDGFSHAGETYQKMATGFGQVMSTLQKVNQVVSAAEHWQGTAQKLAVERSGKLASGVQSTGQETAAAGKALITFGRALHAAQAQLRAAVAEARAAQLIVLPSGDTMIPGWAYTYPANISVLPAMQAVKLVVDAQIKLALMEATAADMACAGVIGKLAAGKLIQEFGSSKTARVAASGAAVVSAVEGLAKTLEQINGADGAGSTGGQSVAPAQPATRTGQPVSGLIGSSALATVLGALGVGGSGTQLAVANPGREVTVNGRHYVIYGDEVREGGSVSWRGRNPGNIRHGDHFGALPGMTVHAGVNGQFAVFPDEQTGMTAIRQVLHNYGHVTIDQAMNRYAPAADHNNPTVYAASVARQIGVPPGSYVDSLDSQQMDSFAQAIRRVEGWREGHVYQLDDPTLPVEVRQAIAGQ
ncbi:MAG: hypothetical protein HY241_07610 [Actinobacteria bacterium]|nr:hypothetical protein [Actinomycetota bacterium]